MPRSPRRPTEVTSRAPTPSPWNPSDGNMARGEGLQHSSQYSPRAERGTVILTDAARHAYRVQLNSGRVLNGVTRIRQSPGDLTLLQHGTPVRVNFSLGKAYIDGVLPLETAAPVEDQINGVTDTFGHGGQDLAFNRNLGGTARSGGEPNDLLPGDFVGQGPDGSLVAALRNKIALLRASPLAQVRAYGDNDVVEIIAGLFRLVTWMGESRYVNDGGKTSFQWRGGADQVTQTGADEEKYTIRLDVGNTGNLFKFEICSTDGQPVARIQVGPDGHGEFFFAGGLDQHTGSSPNQLHAQNYHGERNVQVEGADRLRVSGDTEYLFQGGRGLSVSSSETHTVGQDFTLTINRNSDESVGGVKNLTVQGDYTTVVTGGDFSLDVRAANQVHVLTAAGNQVFEPQAGKFQIATTTPDSVELTRSPDSHGTKYEFLEIALNLFIADYNTFKALMISHVHPIGAPNTLVAPTLAGLIPYVPNWTAAKSLIVKLS